MTVILVLVAGAVAATCLLRQRAASTFRDLYELERTRKEENEVFRAALGSISQGVAIVDPAGMIRDMNRAAEQLTGWGSSEARGRDVADVCIVEGGETGTALRQLIISALTGGSGRIDALLRVRASERRHVSIGVNPIREAGADPAGAVIVISDLTQEGVARRDIAQKEELLRLAMSAANHGLYDLDIETDRFAVSDDYARLLGYEPGELGPTISDWSAIIHPDDLAGMTGAYRDYIAGRSVEYRAEFRMRARDGGWRWILSLGSIVARAADGRPLRMLGTHTDITERKLIETSIREREQTYLDQRNALIDLSFMPSGGDDLNAVYARFTEVAANTLNVDRTSIWLHNGERSAIRCVDLFDRASVGHSSGYVLSRGAAPSYFDALQLLDVIAAPDAGEDPRTAELSEAYLRPLGVGSMLDVPIHAGGEVVGVLCNEHLGTRREFRPEEETFAVALATLLSLRLEELQRAQAEAESRLRVAALEAAAEAVVITDVNGSIVWVNPAFTAVTGYERDEAIGMTPGELLRSGVHDVDFYDSLWRTILDGHVWRGEVANRRKDGSVYAEEQSITPIKDGTGGITHFVAIKHDLTERRQLEAKFLQAQKLESVGRLAGGVAHDFNNLLTVINGTADLAMTSLPDGDPTVEDLRQIRDAGSRAAALTAQLLAFSRRQVMQRETLVLQTIVQSLDPLLRRLIGEDIRVVVNCADEPAKLWADRSQLEQVIMNLAVNARDAMPDGGMLTIDVATTDDDVVLGITDTGVGMSEDVVAHIFEPFFTTKEVNRGTGLGLATVYGIVEQSGGTIEVRSAPHNGTSFTVRFPRVHGEATTHAGSDSAGSDRGTGTVLVVEDEEAVRHVTCRVLQRAGYEVLTAMTGADALAVLENRTTPVDLVVTDVIMPGMGGGELADRITAAWPRTKILFTSGYSEGRIPGFAASDSSPHFIGKPYTVDGLATKVREVLDLP